MKIAISTSGADLTAPVDARFGRAKNFIIYDDETQSFELVENSQNLQAAQGAGIQTAQNVVVAGAQAVITGNCGPKAFAVLSQAGVSVYLARDGSVQKAIDELRAGGLQAQDGANVAPHWM